MQPSESISTMFALVSEWINNLSGIDQYNKNLGTGRFFFTKFCVMPLIKGR